MFKFYNKYLPNSFDNLFKLNKEIHNHNTRQSKNFHAISKQRKQFSISSTGPKIWKIFNLSDNDSKTIEHFKRQMKNKLLENNNGST